MSKKSTIKVWVGAFADTRRLRIRAEYQRGLIDKSLTGKHAREKNTDYGYSVESITVADLRHEDCDCEREYTDGYNEITCRLFNLYVPFGYRDEFIFMCNTVLTMYANGTPVEDCKIEIEVPSVA